MRRTAFLLYTLRKPLLAGAGLLLVTVILASALSSSPRHASGAPQGPSKARTTSTVASTPQGPSATPTIPAQTTPIPSAPSRSGTPPAGSSATSTSGKLRDTPFPGQAHHNSIYQGPDPDLARSVQSVPNVYRGPITAGLPYQTTGLYVGLGPSGVVAGKLQLLIEYAGSQASAAAQVAKLMRQVGDQPGNYSLLYLRSGS